MQVQVQVGRCSSSNKGIKGGGCQCADRRAIPGQPTNQEGIRDVENTLEHSLCNTPGVCVYISCQCLSASWVLQAIVHATWVTVGELGECVQCSTCDSGTYSLVTAEVCCVSVGGLEAGPGEDWNSKTKWWHTVRSRQNVSHCPYCRLLPGSLGCSGT